MSNAQIASRFALSQSPCAFCSYDTTDRSALSRSRDPPPTIRIPLIFPAEKWLHTHVWGGSSYRQCTDCFALCAFAILKTIRIPLVFPAEKRLHTHVFSSSKCKVLSASELAPSPCAWNSCITYFPQIGLLIRRSIRVRTGAKTGLGRRGR